MKLKGPHGHAPGFPRVGDVVLMKENLPRGQWKTGRICELIKGADQNVRSAKVTVAPHKFLYRPLSLLYPIECPDHKEDRVNVCQGGGNDSLVNSDDNDSEDISNEGSIDNSSMEDYHTNHPIRKATIKARLRLKQWLKPDGALILLGSVADHARE